jgi:tetratricopeptide (TPR) repeat protein/predicted Ser/Thr protein kinase
MGTAAAWTGARVPMVNAESGRWRGQISLELPTPLLHVCHMPAGRSPPLPPRDRDPPGESTPGGAPAWGRVKATFLAAVELPDPERAAFVADACGSDPALLREVTALLASDAAAAGFAETPAIRLLGLEPEPVATAAVAPRLAAGARLGNYEILGFLAAGGMGQVYRARDVVLGREVALKTVHGAPDDPHARRRLVREAGNAAMLRHPGVCTVHDVGEADGTPFIVMEFLPGRPLGEVVADAPPALGDVVAWGAQVADALEHAHRHGIVHRDLKSSNVMLGDDGRAVILDFGLARRLLPDAGSDATTMTLTGEVAGTLSHLAPEVLLGGTPDVRSDVWSLGILLYELATGQLPFHGRTHFETSSAILDGELPWHGRHVPLPLRLVIGRCLEKDPVRRYASAGEVRTDLERIRRRRSVAVAGGLLLRARRRSVAVVAGAALLAAVGAVTSPRWLPLLPGGLGPVAALALLPLENATGDDEAGAWYAAGLTEGLGAQLGAALDARLVSPASAARLAASGAAPDAIARGLGAQAVVTGRLRRADDRIVVELRLVDATRGRVLWSESFERPRQQVLALQADMVRQLAAGVQLALRSGAGERIAAVRAVNPEAYEEYLRGRYEWNRRTPESLARALDHFTRATGLDPTYAPAHAALADVYNQYATVMVGIASPREYRPRAEAAAIRALQVDPGSAEAHAALGYVQHYHLQWDEAERSFRHAIELNPSYALAHLWLANLLMSRGDLEQAMAHAQAARQLDPYSLIVNTNIGWIHSHAGRHEEAIRQLEWTLGLDSMYLHARMRLIHPLRVLGQVEQAHAHASRTVELSGRAPFALSMLAVTEARAGRVAEARAVLAELTALAGGSYVPPSIMAEVHDVLGNVDEAVRWLERAYAERANYISYFRPGPGRPGMAGDARVLAMHAAAGLPMAP